MNDDELYHYGVPGMKWGVIHNPSKAFGKSVKKARKLNKKVERAETKLEKKTAKRDKVEKHYSGWGVASKGDVARATSKHYRAAKRLTKAKKKSEKWNSAMMKNFKDTSVKSIDPEVISLGKEYVHMLSGT